MRLGAGRRTRELSGYFETYLLLKYNGLLFKRIGLKTLLDGVMLDEECVSYIRRMSTSNVSLKGKQKCLVRTGVEKFP